MEDILGYGYSQIRWHIAACGRAARRRQRQLVIAARGGMLTNEGFSKLLDELSED